MSVFLLERLGKPHDIFDDLQSLLWVFLYVAVRRFKYDGTFHSRLFDESSMLRDQTHGPVSIGGWAKGTWLERPNITFTCKPLEAFFTSYRRFNMRHLHKLEASSDNEKGRREYEQFEADVKSNLYGLVSHFDTILNDPEADWADQEARGVPKEPLPLPIPQPGAESYRQKDTTLPEPTPLAKAAVPDRKAGKKRKQDEPPVDDGPRSKRPALNKNGDDHKTPVVARPTTRMPRRRRPLPPPSDRVLRPRPWR